MKSKSMLLGLLVSAAVTANANAAHIDAGWDYFFTESGTYFDFGGYLGLGNVQFRGYPSGPGNTDTIVQRLEAIEIGGSGAIQVSALSLVSTNLATPIYIKLDPSKLSSDVGTLTISGSSSGGTFDSFFDVWFDVCLAPGSGCSEGGHKTFTASGSWLPAPPPDAVETTGGFYPTGTVMHVTEGGRHVVSVATTPLPTALPLFGGGLILLGLFGRRRRKKRQGSGTS